MLTVADGNDYVIVTADGTVAAGGEMRVSGNLHPADTFFDLGGDSMLLLELRTRLAERGFRLELQEAFESPTASGMAAILRPSDVEGATPGFG